MNALAELAARWRREAETLRAYGATRLADAAERHAEEATAAFRAWWEQELTITEAADWSGYSRERIRELVRAGEIPDRRPTGARQGIAYRLRRADLPRHPIGKRDPDALPLPGRSEDEGLSPAERAAQRSS